MVYMILHGIVRSSYETFKELYSALSLLSPVFLASQHDADEDIKTTHVHFLIDLSGTKFIEASQPLESFRKKMLLLQKFEKGIYELKTKTQKEKVPYKEYELARYILKGNKSNIHTAWYDVASEQDPTKTRHDYRKDQWVQDIAAARRERSERNIEPSETILVPSRKITDWKLLQELIQTPHKDFGVRDEGSDGETPYYTYETCPTRTLVPPHTLMRLVSNELRNYQMKPTPRRINDFVGSMLMYFDDTQDHYSRNAIGCYQATFEAQATQHLRKKSK